MKTRWWLEIGPLKEGNYTGISQVTAALAALMLEDGGRDTGFFFGRAVVPADIVAEAVKRRNGELLDWYVARAESVSAPADLAVRNVALFPNRKTCRRGFDFEAQIIHDLSTLLTPQFHHKDTIDYHALSMLGDIASNDVTFCVSEATRDDVLRYAGPVDPGRVITCLLGAFLDTPADSLPLGAAVEPYVLVLGTVEPRKNIDQVLQFLADQPHLLRGLRFVFLGRYGWGDSVETLLGRYGLFRAFKEGRIVFPGFVSEPAKLLLLEHARMLIYPSLFEGFGLPVLEAMTLGTPCLTTRSSSLPEVGGALCAYFDPFVAGDFARGFGEALQDTPARRAARRKRAAQFSWSRCYETITTTMDLLLGAGGTHAGRD